MRPAVMPGKPSNPSHRSFDLVFSADVLEHVNEDEAERVVAELVRVSRRHLFLSISLKPHTKVTKF